MFQSFKNALGIGGNSEQEQDVIPEQTPAQAQPEQTPVQQQQQQIDPPQQQVQQQIIEPELQVQQQQIPIQIQQQQIPMQMQQQQEMQYEFEPMMQNNCDIQLNQCQSNNYTPQLINLKQLTPHDIVPLMMELAFDGQKTDEKDEVVGIILTVCDGSSYDSMFRQLKQEVPEGSRIVTYVTNSAALKLIFEFWTTGEWQGDIPDATKATMELVLSQMESTEPDCIVVNFECCSGCSDTGFHNDQENEFVVPFFKACIDRGFMVMCSDFSLKALIHTWSEEILGPNPFVKIGEFNNGFKLFFDCGVLSECPSTQLQKVGELCGDGVAHVHAMPGTIAYNVDLAKADNSAYAMQILSIAQIAGIPVQNPISVGNEQGGAGHVVLNYPSGGKLLTSCGHWCELVKLDVNEDRLFTVATENFSAEYCQNMTNDIQSSANLSERRAKTQAWASKMVQQSTPCQNMYNKRKKGWSSQRKM